MMSAEERVERLFERVSRHDVPVWVGVNREVGPGLLEDAREIAFARADEAGRGALLDLSLERIERAYALHFGDQGYWTGIFAVPVPATSADRVGSQLIMEDLATAVIVEDLVAADVAVTLRADGDRLLRIGNDEDGSAGGDDGAPPVEPFRGPLVTASLAGGIVMALAVGLFGVGLGGMLVAALGIVVLLVRRRPRVREN
jgi:hypothetical protein